IDEALAELDQADRLSREDDGSRKWNDLTHDILSLRAIAWMRRGELDNCLAKHCCESCILPIKAGGTHVVRRGSETAIGLLTKLLEHDSTDYEALWLLNLAH